MIAVPQVGDVDVAPLGEDHLDEVVALEALTARRPWSREVFLEELARDDRHYLVAVGPQVLGFAGIALQAGDAHVMTVVVDPAARRRGIGTRLVTCLLDAAVAAGAGAATLEVRRSNDAARRLYRSAGFRDAGVRPGYYPDGEDAVIMWRDDRSHDPGGTDERPVRGR